MDLLETDPNTPVLNAFLAGEPPDGFAAAERVGVEAYPLAPHVETERDLHALIDDFVQTTRGRVLGGGDSPLQVAEAVVALDRDGRTRLYLALLDRAIACDAGYSRYTIERHDLSGFYDYGGITRWLTWLQERGVDDRRAAAATFRWFSAYRFNYYGAPALVAPVAWVGRQNPNGAVAEPFGGALAWVVGQAADIGGYPADDYAGGAIGRARELTAGDPRVTLPVADEWAARVHHDLAAAEEGSRQAWLALLRHGATATAGKPSGKWAKAAGELVNAVGEADFRGSLARWIALAGRPRVRPVAGMSWESNDERMRMNDAAATVMKGLTWTLASRADAASPRLSADLLSACLKKVRGVGPRCVKVANACVWALGEMAANKDAAIRDAALGQLARLKAKVTFRTTLKAIEKALDKAAEKAGVAKEDLEELGVPAFGFEDGMRVEELGGATATLRLDGNKVTTIWTNDKGKVVKAPPASVKKEFKDDLKEIKQAADDAAGVLLAGRDRLDNLYLADKSWRLSDFRERYLNHGLLGPLVRRLLWQVDGTAVLFTHGAATEAAGKPVDLGETAEVRLWHPIHADLDTTLAWRDRLASLEITQPFKQAHREVYLLTDAERRTNTYSNRFAAHVVRQHQFNALCAARGWRNQLRLMVDDSYEPPRRDLPAHGLRAEFWVEGIGDDYGTDTTDSGSYLRLATDQVRFYRTGAAKNYQHAGGGRYDTHGPADEAENHPLHLADVPPLVLSEILRDCDLFVGVSSVGNDPTWQDGGPEGRFRDYWQSYSFGDLTQTAQTRKAVLEKLVPRLKIAGLCSFSDKFLVVRGERRTYKIHLGSGNILMEPNDQYLCIVPGRQADSAADSQFLPFEGDRTMSVIVSKALMLADDAKIKDPTINSQIGRGK